MKAVMKMLFITIFLAAGTLSLNAQTRLPRSTPCAEGVDAQGVIDFIDSVEQSNVELHSLMIIRHGKVVAEGWWNPYKSDYKHIMYSVSKTLTSMAIGMAIADGKLSINDKVISFFPDDLPDTVSANLEAMTVKDLLTMTAGQDPPASILLDTQNWVRAFLAAPVVDKPSSRFVYNSSATYMVSAIFHKVMGQRVFDYLKSRIFDPLSITDIDSEVDPMGIDVGGWGMRIRTEDMAKIGQLLLQKGRWNGKQLIPEQWIAEASAAHVLQDALIEPSQRDDWSLGYGYQIWRSMYNSYRADGAHGQYILVMPDKDAVVIMTAANNDINLIWKFLYPAIRDTALAPNKVVIEKLNKKLASLELAAPIGDSTSSLISKIAGKKYEVRDSLGHKFMVSIDFEGTHCKVGFDGGREIRFGASNWVAGKTEIPGPYYFSKNGNMAAIEHLKVAGSYRFTDPKTLELTLRYTECTDLYVVKCIFDGDRIDVVISTNMGPYTILMEGVRK